MKNMKFDVRKSVTIFVLLFLFVFISNFALQLLPFPNLVTQQKVFSKTERAFDSDEKAFLVAENAVSYRSDGIIVAYVKSTLKGTISLYNIETNSVTNITTPTGDKKITHLSKGILVYDVTVNETNIDVYAYHIEDSEVIPIEVASGIQKEGVTNGKFVVWWNANDSGNLWAYNLTNDDKFKITQNDFPNFSDWFDTSLNQRRNDGNDYKISPSDYLIYGITQSTNSQLDYNCQKIVSYDLRAQTKHILTQGTTSDFGFYPVIYYDTVLYSNVQPVEGDTHFKYTIYRYNPMTKQSESSTNQKWNIFSQTYSNNMIPKPYVSPSFFSVNRSRFCSFDGKVIDLGQELLVFSFPAYNLTVNNSLPVYLFGNGSIYVGMTDPGANQVMDYRIISYQTINETVTLVTPPTETDHLGEYFLSFQNNIFSWVDTGNSNRLYIRSAPDVNLTSAKNRVGLKQNSSVTFAVVVSSKLSFATSLTLASSFPNNPTGLTCSFSPSTVQLNGVDEVTVNVTINSTSSTPKGTYSIIIETQGTNFLLPQKLTIVVDVADFTIRVEKLHDQCFLGTTKVFKIYIKNLLTTAQTYSIESSPDYSEGEEALMPAYMEYSFNVDSIIVPAGEELFINFSVLMKPKINTGGYNFTFKVKNQADQVELAQDLFVYADPSFWIETNRNFQFGGSGTTVKYEIFVCANSNYTGTIHLMLDGYTSDRFTTHTFTPNDFTLTPNERKTVILEIPIGKIYQSLNYDIMVIAEDTTTEESFHFGDLSLLAEPSFSVTISCLNDLPVLNNTTSQWLISITSFSSSGRTISLSRNPDFPEDTESTFEFSTTTIVFQNAEMQTSTLSITTTAEGLHSFPLLIKDVTSDEIFIEMIHFSSLADDSLNIQLKSLKNNGEKLTVHPNESICFAVEASLNMDSANSKQVAISVIDKPAGSTFIFESGIANYSLLLNSTDSIFFNAFLILPTTIQAGEYSITILATCGAYTKESELTFDVEPFWLTIPPNTSMTLMAGTSDVIPLQLTSPMQEDFNVKIFVLTPPKSHIYYSLDPEIVDKNGITQLRIATTNLTAPGNYIVKIKIEKEEEELPETLLELLKIYSSTTDEGYRDITNISNPDQGNPNNILVTVTSNEKAYVLTTSYGADPEILDGPSYYFNKNSDVFFDVANTVLIRMTSPALVPFMIANYREDEKKINVDSVETLKLPNAVIDSEHQTSCYSFLDFSNIDLANLPILDTKEFEIPELDSVFDFADNAYSFMHLMGYSAQPGKDGSKCVFPKIYSSEDVDNDIEVDVYQFFSETAKPRKEVFVMFRMNYSVEGTEIKGTMYNLCRIIYERLLPESEYKPGDPHMHTKYSLIKPTEEPSCGNCDVCGHDHAEEIGMPAGPDISLRGREAKKADLKWLAPTDYPDLCFDPLPDPCLCDPDIHDGNYHKNYEGCECSNDREGQPGTCEYSTSSVWISKGEEIESTGKETPSDSHTKPDPAHSSRYLAYRICHCDIEMFKWTRQELIDKVNYQEQTGFGVIANEDRQVCFHGWGGKPSDGLPSIYAYLSQGTFATETNEKTRYGYKHGYGGIEACYDYNPDGSERRKIKDETIEKWENILIGTLPDIKERYIDLEKVRFAFISGGSNTKRWWHTSEGDWMDWCRNLVYLRDCDPEEPINALEEGKAVVSEEGSLIEVKCGSAKIADVVEGYTPSVFSFRAKSAWTGHKAKKYEIHILYMPGKIPPIERYVFKNLPAPIADGLPDEGWQIWQQAVQLKGECAVYIKCFFEGEYGGLEQVVTNPIFFFCIPSCNSLNFINFRRLPSDATTE